MIKGQEEQCKTKINKICDYYNTSQIKKDLKTETDFKNKRSSRQKFKIFSTTFAIFCNFMIKKLKKNRNDLKS